jgi:hypothetical protein
MIGRRRRWNALRGRAGVSASAKGGFTRETGAAAGSLESGGLINDFQINKTGKSTILDVRTAKHGENSSIDQPPTRRKRAVRRAVTPHFT